MPLYAVTINQGHVTYSLDLQVIATQLKNCLDYTFLELVVHSNDHIHGLINCDYSLEQLIKATLFHVERIRNSKAYIKYMHSHDETNSLVIGELGYHEVDDIVDSVLALGPVATVQKYGFQALRYYKQIKSFYDDFMTGGYNHETNEKNKNDY